MEDLSGGNSIMDHGYCRKYKRVGLQDDTRKSMRNVTQGCFLREIGRYKNTVPSEFQWAAEDRLIDRNKYEEMKCQLPGTPRSTFLMVFSPDGKRVASTHGNHNVYVTDLRTGKNIQTLTGHPRTPWCIAFHPSSNQILASGCLGGQVRVWDLHGGSEVWTTEGQTVIASLAFHPVDRMLVIATYNELHFWDWSQPEPFAKCTTKTEREKVRYVSFDSLGTKLITGIANPVNIPSQWDRVNVTTSQPQFTFQPSTSTTTSSSHVPVTVATTSTSTEQGRSITYCYRHLVNQYNSLFRRYFHLMQPRMIPTMDRGTDPMDLVDLQNASTSANDNNNNSSNICVCHNNNNNSGASTSTQDTSRGNGTQNLVAEGSLNDLSSRNVTTTATISTTSTTTVSSTNVSTPTSGERHSVVFTIGTSPNSTSFRLIELFPRTSQSSSGAVTNPTYTSYNERGIFSTREGGSSNQQSPIRVFVENLGAESCSRTQPYERSRSRNQNQQEDEEVERNLSRPRVFLNPRRSVESDNSTTPSPNVSLDRVFEVVQRDNDAFTPVRRNTDARPAFGFQIRPRTDNPAQIRRQISFRPGGQFVLSRHSNSPFQPRKPHPIDNSSLGAISRNNKQSRPVIPSCRSSFSSARAPSTTASTSRPIIPSCWSSFTASTSSATFSRPVIPSCWSSSSVFSRSPSRTYTRTETPSCSSTFTTRTPIPSTNVNNVRNNESRNRLYFFDRVKTLLRDRILNSPESANSDSTINFSNMENFNELPEPNLSLDNEIRNLLETANDGNDSALGPRGLDPMLSSTADNSEPPSNELNISQPDLADPWESEPRSENSNATQNPNTTLNPNATLNLNATLNPNATPPLIVDEPERQSGETASTAAAASPEFSIRQGVQILSLHIENMQRLCRARIEILQLQQIRKMWEDLTTQIRSLHSLVQDSRNWLQTPENDNSNRDPIIPSVSHLMRLAISDNAPETSPSASANPEPEKPPEPKPSTSNSDNHYSKLVESMVNALLDDKSQPSTSKPEESTQERTQPERNETEEPQPSSSGTSNPTIPETNESSSPNRENLKMRIYRAIRNIIQKTRRKREGRSAESSNLRLGESSRPRFRSHRHYRYSSDSATARSSRSYTRQLDAVHHLTRNIPNSSTPEPTTSRNDACQSCGQRKRPFKDFIRQKRRSTDTNSNPLSKALKNSSGKRIEPSTSRESEEPAPSASQSTSQDTPSTSTGVTNNPTTELLRRMIERMETMVRFQREAFRRTEELAGNRSRRSESRSLPNSGDSSDSDRDSSESQRELYMRNARHERKLLRRAEFLNTQSDTQLRARRLLSYMVRSLTEFFEESSNDASRVLDEQITNLYTLLHLALELTDLLMEQLNATSRDLETNFSINNVDRRESSQEGRALPQQLPQTSLSSSRASRRFLERGRSRQILESYRRSRYGASNTSNLNSSTANNSSDNNNISSNNNNTTNNSNSASSGSNSVNNNPEPRRIYPNPFLRSHSRSSNRLNSTQPMNRANTVHYRPCAIWPGYRRLRRASSRTSTPLTTWYGRGENISRRPNPETGPANGPENFIRFSHFVPGRFFPSTNGGDHGVDFRELRPVTPRDLLNINNSNNSNTTPNNSNNNSSSSSNTTPLLATNPSNEESRRNNNETPERDQNQNQRDDGRMIEVRFRVEETPQTSSANTNESPLREGSFTIPVVQVNDVPVPDVAIMNPSRNRVVISPVPRQREDIWRWRPWRPRFLHPRYFAPNPFEDQDSNDVSENIHYYRMGFSVGLNQGGWSTIDPTMIADAPISPHHRIQAWDFSKMTIPDISDREANGVVAECKIHNDASVDISRDGHLLVTLLPNGRHHSLTTTLGVYSLDWSNLGQLLYKTGFVQNAVSVSLSPTNRHLLVGLASRPLMLRDQTCMGQIFRLDGARPREHWSSGQGRLVHMRDLEHSRETTTMSINCIRWAPVAGEGFVYGTNTGQLKVLR